MSDSDKLKIIEMLILRRVDNKIGNFDWLKTEEFKLLNTVLGVIDGTGEFRDTLQKDIGVGEEYKKT